MLKKSEKDEAEEIKKVAQTVACFYAIGGVLLPLLTLSLFLSLRASFSIAYAPRKKEG